MVDGRGVLGKDGTMYEAVTVGLPDEVDVVCYFMSRRDQTPQVIGSSPRSYPSSPTCAVSIRRSQTGTNTERCGRRPPCGPVAPAAPTASR